MKTMALGYVPQIQSLLEVCESLNFVIEGDQIIVKPSRGTPVLPSVNQHVGKTDTAFVYSTMMVAPRMARSPVDRCGCGRYSDSSTSLLQLLLWVFVSW